MKMRIDRFPAMLIVIGLLPVALLTGCQANTPSENIDYQMNTYAYKVVDGLEIQADVYRIAW